MFRVRRLLPDERDHLVDAIAAVASHEFGALTSRVSDAAVGATNLPCCPIAVAFAALR